MLQDSKTQISLKGAFELLKKDGILILPTKLGYAILAMTQLGVDKLYRLKERPLEKPSGILATPEIFLNTTNSNIPKNALKIPYPLGLIEKTKETHPAVRTLPLQINKNNTIAYFFNMDPFLDQLARLAWRSEALITVSSANKAGAGNCLEFEKLHPDFKTQADLVIEKDDLRLANDRNDIDNICSTIIDLTARKLVRPGVYAARAIALAVQNDLITDHLQTSPIIGSKGTYFRSCIYLLAYKSTTYQKIKSIRDMDWLVLDLEDSCPPDKKEQARQLIEQHAHSGTFNQHQIGVRLNELDNDEALKKDLEINFTPKVRAFALPMLRSPQDVKKYDFLVSNMENRLGLPEGTFKFFPIIETPEALNHAAGIAKASSRNIAMFLGHADLFGELNAQRTSQNLHTVRMLYLSAAREAGIAAFDTPYENVKDLDGLEKDALEGRSIGLDGKVALSFEQKEIINQIFGLNSALKDKYENLLTKYEGGCQIIDGVFLAPPVVRKIKKELEKRVYQPSRPKVPALRGRTLSYGLDYKNAFPGQIIESPYETTIDESWITSWQAMVQTGNPLETSLHFCQLLDLQGRLIPFQTLVNLALCLVVESFSESSLFHLGISHVIYERPAYTGDTLRSVMILDAIIPSSNKKYSIFKTRMILINQNGQKIVSMNRNSLFPYIDPSLLPDAQPQTNHRDYPLFQEPPKALLRERLLKTISKRSFPRLQNQAIFKEGELILHSLTRPMGLSNSLAYSTLYKNTHPLHINNARYGMDGLVVCGGFIIPIMHASASRDIRFALDHEIIDTMHINKIHHEDAIGAMSYISKVEKIHNGMECITIRTFGLKNLDAERALIHSEIPEELLKSPKIKPSEIESLCKTFCPELHHKICARMTWRMWRKV